MGSGALLCRLAVRIDRPYSTTSVIGMEFKVSSTRTFASEGDRPIAIPVAVCRYLLALKSKIFRRTHRLLFLQTTPRTPEVSPPRRPPPPISAHSRLEAGYLLRLLQRGKLIELPHSGPMPSIGRRCHELRIDDQSVSWRVVYRVDDDAIVIGEVFSKKTGRTPKSTIETCKERFRQYDRI